MNRAGAGEKTLAAEPPCHLATSLTCQWQFAKCTKKRRAGVQWALRCTDTLYGGAVSIDVWRPSTNEI